MKGFPVPAGSITKNEDGNDTFVPEKLPPEFELEEAIPLISEASYLIGTLNGLGKKLVNPDLLIRPLLMKEAIQSSKIEGSQVSLTDLYNYKLGNSSYDSRVINTEEVNNYVDALEMSLHKVSNGADIDQSLINECHKMLLRRVRGSETTSGALRVRQNWIGTVGAKINNAIYVPPSPEKVPELMKNLIDFMNNPPRKFGPLLQCAIVHYQFEAIHPYEDGNGRIGRLLVPLMLANKKLLSVPLLYLSGYIEQNKNKYYELLFNVSSNSDWVKWLKFFLLAVIEQAKTAIDVVEKLDELHVQYLDKVNIKYISRTVIQIVNILFKSPIITRRMIADSIRVSDVVAKNGIDKLVQLGILEESGIYKTRKVYIASEIWRIIE